MSNSEILKWLRDLKEKYEIVGAPVRYSKYIDRIIKIMDDQGNKPSGDRYKVGYSAGYDDGYEAGFRDGHREVID